jgi:proline iminopeptidase
MKINRRKQRMVVFVIVFLGVTVFLVVTARVHTEPFRDSKGNVVPGSVAVMEKHTIGGLPQMLWFRSVSADNPVLILLHGGPGASESTLSGITTAS